MEFRVLGPVEVRVAGQPVAAGHARQRAVLAVLVLELGHVVPAELLIDRIWGENPPASVRNLLYGYLARLRAALASAADPGVSLSRQQGGYLLRCAPELVDLFRFRHLAAEAASAGDEHAVSLLGEALALWHGSALAGLHSLWLDAMRQSLEMERTAADLNLNDIRLRRGQHGALAAELAGQAADRPTDERLIGQLVLALYRSGRQAEALAAYRQTRRVLVEELGTEPGPELQQLHQQILTADPALRTADPAPTASAAGQAGPAPPRQLPAAVAGFTGRAAELAALTSIPDGAGATADAGGGAPGTVVMSAQQRLDNASRELAIAVARQWRAEAVMRSLGRPEPIQLGWSITRRTAAVVPLAVRRRDPRMGAVPSNLHGDLSHLITEFRRLPKRQLVVLGEPGAGKTALAVLLTLGLLANPEPREPVPVLLPLSSWDPRNEHLYTWFAHRLTEEYPGLGNVAAYGPHVARRLVTEERVLPVLDGLDEMPPVLQSEAIDAIDRATAGGRPLVLTCRSTEYEEAVLRGGVILSSAMVVEMQPVNIEDAARFLAARQHPALSGWQPVVEHMRSHLRGPLAQVMSTPLMVDLARTAYGGSASDPAELSDSARFTDRASLEGHLLGTFLPAAYPRRLPPLTPAAAIGPVRTLHQYGPEQARRWLTFLARHLKHTRSREIAWWQLADAVPAFIRGLIFGLPPALLYAVAGDLAGGPAIAIVYGVASALAGFITNSLARRSGPLRVELRFRGTGRRFLGRFAVGLVIGVVFGLAWTLPPGFILVLVLAFGLALGVQVWLDTPADINRVSSPLTVLRQERLAATWFSLSFALSVGTLYAVADTFTQETDFLVVFGGSFDIVLGLAAGVVGVLLGHFAFGRAGSVAYGLATFAMGGMIFSRANSIAAGFLTGAVFGIAVGLSIFLSRAWGSFILARIWFAARRQMPLRLMRFLADAHRRAVLRQVGAVYQFRHARLQDNLAKQDG
jgi:DNA-binding SARP family transcriptional activator